MWRRFLLTALFCTIGMIALACESVTHANDFSASAVGVSSCGAGTLLCNGACIAQDTKNCTGCGAGCDPGQVCSSGVCGSQCNGGTTQCTAADGTVACIDTQNDPQNCGRCGGPADAGTCVVCQSGKCRNDCPKPTSLCHGRCFDFSNDPNNCGSCGHACDKGLFCSAGVCGASCGTDEVQCNGSCINPQTSAAHCTNNNGAACEAPACPAPQDNGNAACIGGQCAVACDVGFTHCDDPINVTGNPGVSCANLLTDPNHCGVCANACQLSQQCVLGKCQGG